MQDERERRGGGGSRRPVKLDFPPTLVKRAVATFCRIVEEAPPGTPKGGPYSDSLTKHVEQVFHDILVLSVERGLPHLTPRPKRGQ